MYFRDIILFVEDPFSLTSAFSHSSSSACLFPTIHYFLIRLKYKEKGLLTCSSDFLHTSKNSILRKF